MQSLTASAAKPLDDIDAVLGRFQAWSASTRKATDKTSRREKISPTAYASSPTRRPLNPAALAGRPAPNHP